MPAQTKSTDKYQTRVVGGADLVKGRLHRLRVMETIDPTLMHQPKIDATYGKLAQGMIANRLTFTPAPLSQLASWAAEHGLERVFGVDAAWLDDDRLGAMLEGLADHPVEIWSRVLGRAVDRFEVDLGELPSDTTSVYFEGAYEDESGRPLSGGERVPRLIEGYNQDGQRHKVQLVLSLITSGRTPVWYRPWDGTLRETDEALYVADRGDLRQTLLAPQNAVLVGDRKLCTQATLVCFSQQHQWFLGAHPWTDSAKAVWVETQPQLAAGQYRWQTVDYASQNDVRKPAAERTVYRGCEVSRELADPETGELYPLRWVFSHSSTKAAQDARQRDKAVAAGEQALRRIAGLLGKYDYTRRATIEVRLEQAVRKVPAWPYFSYTLHGEDDAGDFQLHWRRWPRAIHDAEVFDGVARLCTNVPAETWAAPTVMIKYQQQVVAEQAFDFIKSPVQIRPTCTWVENRPPRHRWCYTVTSAAGGVIRTR